MNSYTFWQSCRPQGDYRIRQMVEFFNLMKQAFAFPVLYDMNGKPVEISDFSLQQRFERKRDKRFPKLGVNLDFFSIPPRNRDDDTIRFEICAGTHPDKDFIDMYDITIGEARLVPHFLYLRASIEIFRPFEAFLSEFNNEANLNWFERMQEAKFERPALIRGFHYLDAGMVRSIGGMDHCLKAPAWRVERFCEGVLIQLVEGLFDTTNPQHVRIQRDAMEYFKIW